MTSHRLLIARRLQLRSQVAMMSQEEGPRQNLPSNIDEDSVIEEDYIISKFYKQDLVAEEPIKALNIVDRVDKIKKVGSFSCDLHTGLYDHDYLNYPEPLYDRIESNKLKEQAIMVKQLFPKIWNDESQLQKYNFFNLFQLSVTEMMTVFEGIGQSLDECRIDSDGHDSNHHSKLMTVIYSLINRNCLTYWPIFKSNNTFAKSLIPESHIQFGGSSLLNREPYLPIGFCWTEQVHGLGVTPPQEWETYGRSGDESLGLHYINGMKANILNDPRYEFFLTFYRDKELTDLHNTDDLKNQPNPASDPFMGCSIVHKSNIQIGPTYKDSYGIEYFPAKIDGTINDEARLVKPSPRDPKCLNIRALGQLATCALTIGILKGSLAKTYKNLIDYKTKLLTCDIADYKLATVTSRIFALESMLYYITGMYDGLDEGFDAHMEATILKIQTYDMSREALNDLQLINGVDIANFGKTLDKVITMDSFFDGPIFNRLYLSTMGVIWYARSKNVHLNKLRLSPWYFGYFLKTIIRDLVEKSDWITIDADIHGMIHPSLNEAATNLLYIVKRVRFATEQLCINFGEDVTGAQTFLHELSQITCDVFMLTTMCARASKSYCNGSRNSVTDVSLTTHFSQELMRRVEKYITDLKISKLLISNECKIINELNIRAGGYYAESPLDPNV